MKTEEITTYDLDKLENEARRMRAEALAYGTRASASWVKGLFQMRGGDTKPAV